MIPMPNAGGESDDKVRARLNRDAQLNALAASRNADAARKSREAQTVNAQKTLSYGGARVGNLPVETQERLVHRASGMTMNPMQRTANIMQETGGLNPGALPNANAVAQQTASGIQQNAIQQANTQAQRDAAFVQRQAGANAVHQRAMAADAGRMGAVSQAEQTGQSLQGVLAQQSVANAGVAGVNNAAFRQPLGLGSGNATSVSAPAAVGSVGPGMDPAQAQALLAQHEALPTGSMAASQQRGFDAVQAARPGSGMGAGLERAAGNVVSTAGGASISQKDVMDFARSSGQDFVSAKRQLEGEARDRFSQTQAADRQHELANRSFDAREVESENEMQGRIRQGEAAAKFGAEAEATKAEAAKVIASTTTKGEIDIAKINSLAEGMRADAQVKSSFLAMLGGIVSNPTGIPDELLESIIGITAALEAQDVISPTENPFAPKPQGPPSPVVTQRDAAPSGSPNPSTAPTFEPGSYNSVVSQIDALKKTKPSVSKGASYREYKKKMDALLERRDILSKLGYGPSN